METAVGIQPDLSSTYKSTARKMKMAYREGSKREKEEGS